MHSESRELAPSTPSHFAAALLCGLAAFAVGLQLAGLSLKMTIAGAIAAGILAFAFWSGRPKAVFLAAWAFSLTYNRQYFVFEALVGSHGAQGPYLIVSDLILLTLLALWLYEVVVQKSRSPWRGRRLWPWYLPFVAVCLFSVLLAERKDWGAFELIRVLKVGLILAYFRAQVGRVEWTACAVGLGLAVVAQGSLGTAEVVTGRSGVLGILGLGSPQIYPAEFQQEAFYGWRRATGTMSHPPNLACYLLLTIPLFAVLALGLRNRVLRAIALAVAVVGVVGLAFTLSRWPWVLSVLQGALVLAGLVALRVLDLKHALGLASVAAFVGMLVVALKMDFIVDRLTRDLRDSIEFRAKENAAGMKMAMDYPFLGVGLNNYRQHLLRYSPEWAWALPYEELSIKVLHVRPIAAPHNGFLSLFAEVGLLGVLAYGIYLIGVALTALRAVRSTTGWLELATFGIAVGFVGLVLQQAIDFSLWTDPLLYTFAMMVGMLNVAPELIR